MEDDDNDTTADSKDNDVDDDVYEDVGWCCGVGDAFV